MGASKRLVRLNDLSKFIGNTTFTFEGNSATSNVPTQSYNTATSSILIEDISEQEYTDMVNHGIKEHKPYYDEQKKRWCIALSLGTNADGKRIRKVISGVTQADVWDAYRVYLRQQKELAPIPQASPILKEELAQEMELVTYSPKEDVLFEDCFNKYLNGLESGIVNRTYGDYIALSKYIIGKLGQLKMYEINQEVLDNFLNGLREEKYPAKKRKGAIPDTYYSQSHINKVFDLLHVFIKKAANGELGDITLPRDYLSSAKKPRTKALRSDEVKAYTATEISNILKAVENSPMISCWVHIMADIGVRPSEALALRWDDFDLVNLNVKITKALGKEATYDLATKKRTSKFVPIIKDLKNDGGQQTKVDYQRRKLPITQQTADALSIWKSEVEKNKSLTTGRKYFGTEDYVFTSVKGNLRLYDDYKKQYDKLLKNAGIKEKKTNPFRLLQ